MTLCNQHGAMQTCGGEIIYLCTYNNQRKVHEKVQKLDRLSRLKRVFVCVFT